MIVLLTARVSVCVALQVVISADDGIRAGATAASLAGLRTVFKKDGTTTAGNSSQVCIACLLLVSAQQSSFLNLASRQHTFALCGLDAFDALG
jgi:acetyl-CoA acetyltransferase